MQEESVEKLEQKALSIPDKVKTIEVKDNETLNVANRYLLDIKNFRSKIDEFFSPIIKKAHDAHKEALAQKKKIEQPLIDAELYIKHKISSYFRYLEQKKREAERKEMERKEAEEAFGGEKITKPVETVTKPKLEGASIKKTWKFRIIKKDLIPHEYWMLDLQKIGKDVRESKGKINIPGIEIYAEDIVSARKDF